MQLPGLSVDQVRGQGSGVPPEEGVRERAVAPEEAGQMQPDEQLHQCVEQPGVQVADAAHGEERPVGEAELQVPGDQDGPQLIAVRIARRAFFGRKPCGWYPAFADDPDHLYHRHRCCRQLTQQPVLALGKPGRQLLERVEDPVVVNEAHDVTADPARHFHDSRRAPLRQRLVPRQVQEVRPRLARQHLEAHRRKGR